MKKNGTKESVIKLWGHEFNLAQQGLDETQVVSFVNGLIDERDRLTQRQEHFTSLTKLAEKTVAEADELAEEIKKETRDQAKAEAKEIIAKAEEQAQQLIAEERTKIINKATEEATAIKARAEREAELLLEKQRRKIEPELRDIAQQIYGQIASQLESLKQQVATSETEFEHKLSQFIEEDSTATIDKEPPSTPAPDTSSEVSLKPADDILSESQQLTQTVDPTNTSKPEEKTPVPADNQDTTTYEGEVELEILPPIDLKRVLGILEYLDSLPEIETTELIPIADGPLIVASLREPMPLIDILRTLPEIEQVKEDTNREMTDSTDTAYPESERRRIQITLSGNTVLDEGKERLNSRVSGTLSPQPHPSPK